ncbi:hypothetical protein [Rothia sp. ZJ932]|uniref:hypothetical protein n=1 Tax=Rothia sp. ZJ932 TaxID=2810516 RepID=UPI001966E26E|nr:hypothetical protein [Rothia sp. ZJ932]QRZ61787.1 hypothetical protein JR346_01195 [Rothia sp. ZJ932]
MNTKEQTPKTPFLAPFPVITISLTDTSISVTTQGALEDQSRFFVAGEYTNDELNSIGAELTSNLLSQLLLDEDVRVDLYDQNQQKHHMWYSAENKALYPLETPGLLPKGSKIAPYTQDSKVGKIPIIGPRIAALPREQRLLLGIIASFALAIVLVLGAKNFLGATDSQKSTLPPAAQLPVTAPAGWDTYADYAVDADKVSPLLVNDEILYAHKDNIMRISADTGELISQHPANNKISALNVVSGLGENVISVESSGTKASIGTIGGEMTALEKPEEATSITWVSGVPVYQGVGFVWVPDKDGNLSKYIAPADSKPAVIDGKSIWMVSDKEPLAWHITTDAPELPEPVNIPVAEGYDYQGLITGINNHIILGFGKDLNTQGLIEIIDATGPGLLENPRTLDAKASKQMLDIDVQRNLVLSQGTFLDVESNEAMKVSSSARYGAGYAWTTGLESQRVSPDGEVVAWNGSTNAVVPAAIDAAGRAVVVYKPNTSEAGTKLYVLQKID